MTDIGDKLRAFAKECDERPDLTGTICCISGEYEIHLLCADPQFSDEENLMGMVAAVSQCVGQSVGHTKLKPVEVPRPTTLGSIN